MRRNVPCSIEFEYALIYSYNWDIVSGLSEAEDLQGLQLVLGLLLDACVLECMQQLLEGCPVHAHCLFLHFCVGKDEDYVDCQLHLAQGTRSISLEPLLPCLELLFAEVSVDYGLEKLGVSDELSVMKKEGHQSAQQVNHLKLFLQDISSKSLILPFKCAISQDL